MGLNPMALQTLLQQLKTLVPNQPQPPGGMAPQGAGSPMPPPGMPSAPAGPGGTAPFQPSQGGTGASSQGSPSPYNIKQDPMSGVGNLQPPIPQPRTQTPNFRGGPVAGLLQLLSSWHNTRQKGEQSEAANAAAALMQSIEGAKQSGDWTPTYNILHTNEKLFNKVYKGWLQQNEAQQKEKQTKQKPPDPDVQGFEQGVKQYLSKKQAQPNGSPPQGAPPPQGAGPGAPQGPPPPGSAPSSIGGYQLPAAGPQQQLQQQAVSAERQAQRQDPGRSLQGQLSSDEQRQVELTKTGMATTPETQARLETEQAKLKAEIQKSYSEVQIAQQNAQKAQFDMQRASTLAQNETTKGGIDLKKSDATYQKALVDLDISKSKLALQVLKTKTGATTKAPPVMLRGKFIAAEQAESYVKSILETRGKNGFSKQDVQDLQGMLRQAGSTSLANSLNSWWGQHMPNWLGGSGQEDVQGLLNSITSYKTGLKQTLDDSFPGWDGKSKAKDEDDDDSTVIDDDHDIVVDPKDLVTKPN
jgi:hypothetical protein